MSRISCPLSLHRGSHKSKDTIPTSSLIWSYVDINILQIIRGRKSGTDSQIETRRNRKSKNQARRAERCEPQDEITSVDAIKHAES